MLRAIDLAAGAGRLVAPIFAQTGCCNYAPRHFPYKDFLPYEEVCAYIERADVVVLHAGVGSVLTSLSLGKIPIVLARRLQFKEHLDDHQIEFSQIMATTRKVLAAANEEELIRLIQEYQGLVNGLGHEGPAIKTRKMLVSELQRILRE